MAKHNCILAEKMFDAIQHGESSVIVFGGAWNEYIKMEEDDLIVPQDIIQVTCADTSETLTVLVQSVYTLDGVTVVSIDVSKNEHVYVLDRIPKMSLNQMYSKSHWGYRKNCKDDITTIVWAQMKQTRIHYKCDVEYTFLFKNRPLDTVNCAGMVKMIEDVMVVNDAPNFIRSNKFSSGVLSKEESGHLTDKQCRVIIKIIY